nr:YchJ family metal-binding protein [Micromonospora sp. DSM 115978]
MARRDTRRTAAGSTRRPCPCGTGHPYAECCGPVHQGGAVAPTAEALMRSRFSAFAVGDAAYLLRTWHPTTRPARLTLDPRQRWTHLEILASERGGLFDTTGTVEFRAHYRTSDGPGPVHETGSVHENSHFAREDGRWVYLAAAG